MPPLPPQDGPDDDLESAIEDTAWVICPYCGEEVELLIDLGGGNEQSFVEDCEVCCRPWNVIVDLSTGMPVVTVSTLDED